MKSILETSVYLMIATIICYMGVDFIGMNMRVSKINEISQFVHDYVEIYGYSELNEDGIYELDSKTKDMLDEVGKENYVNIACSYANSTNKNIYYKCDIAFTLGSNILGIKKEQINSTLVKVRVV